MGLLIVKTGTMEKWEIPLMKGDLPPLEINDWDDNEWMIYHLRQLADKIEAENPRIMNIGLRSDCQYKSPQLYIEIYERFKG